VRERCGSAGPGAAVGAGLADTARSGAGRLTARPCTTKTPPATIDGENLTVGPIMSTRMACLSDELTKQEHTVLDLLGKASGTHIIGSQLEVTSAGGSLFFRAQ